MLTAFFWWTAWATVTERPDSAITYTNNWPGEPLVGDRPSASMFLWSAFSVIFLIAGIALLGWHHAVTEGRREERLELPATDPMRSVVVTPSMKATAKYFWVLLAMFCCKSCWAASPRSEDTDHSSPSFSAAASRTLFTARSARSGRRAPGVPFFLGTRQFSDPGSRVH